jgi:UDP-4-amino-4,6-dideoxy-N-acetyl-beta-L-altrosamine transaminase
MSNIDFIPYGMQQIENEDVESVIDVMRSPYLTQGPVVNDFEAAISSKVGVKYTAVTNSATSALHIACLSLGLKKGDYLWTVSISFVASANCALYCGAEVDFIDIDVSTGLLDVAFLRKKLISAAKTNTLPKIVVPVHLCGAVCDMKSIYELSKEFGFKIIEDASHALGSKYEDGNYVGSCVYSDITVFSFHPVKIITSGEGGAACTNSDTYADKLFMLRTHGITKEPDRFQGVEIAPWHYEQQYLGYNYRMTDIQAALGLSQLKRLDYFTGERNRIRHIYEKSFSSLPLKLLPIPRRTYSSVHLVVALLEQVSDDIQLKLFNYLRSSRIGVQVHYMPIHLQPYYRGMGFSEGYLSNSENYSTRAISLPVFPSLTNEMQDYVINQIHEFYHG